MDVDRGTLCAAISLARAPFQDAALTLYNLMLVGINHSKLVRLGVHASAANRRRCGGACGSNDLQPPHMLPHLRW